MTRKTASAEVSIHPGNLYARGRKPVAPAAEALSGETLDHAEPLIRADLAAVDDMTAAAKMFLDYEEVARQVGQIEALEFTRRVGDVAISQIFENIRNSGKYKGFPYRDENGRTRLSGSLEEFCRAKLGRSYNRCIELSQNLRLLGPELYEQSEKLGLRNIDYKALRALPADDQEAVKAAIEEGKSRDDLIDLLQEMAVRHHQTTTALTGEVEELKANAEAQARVMADKTAAADRLALELEKTRRLVESRPRDEQIEALRLLTGGKALAVESAIANELAPAVEELVTADATLRPYLDGLFAQIEQRLADVRAQYGLAGRAALGWIDADTPAA